LCLHLPERPCGSLVCASVRKKRTPRPFRPFVESCQRMACRRDMEHVGVFPIRPAPVTPLLRSHCRKLPLASRTTGHLAGHPDHKRFPRAERSQDAGCRPSPPGSQTVTKADPAAGSERRCPSRPQTHTGSTFGGTSARSVRGAPDGLQGAGWGSDFYGRHRWSSILQPSPLWRLLGDAISAHPGHC
jgi:hypothetical protein